MQLDLTSLKRSLFVPKRVPTEKFDLDRHLQAAVDWISRAHEAAPEGGISKGYDTLRGRWDPSYPETTGYTIPTLLNVAVLYDRPELKRVALSLADYLLSVTTEEGGVSHWAAPGPEPVVFDTGQVIFGWLAAYQITDNEIYLRAARRAGDWLLSIQSATGAWKEGQHLGHPKVIDTRVSWALVRLGQALGETKYRDAAIQNLNWALSKQDPRGWFRDASFTPFEDPFTHTLAYTAEGLFESGRLLGEMKYISAARKTADALLCLRRNNGSLSSTYSAGWKETSRSSCLTGNCQMAMLWLDLHFLTGEVHYLAAAEMILRFVAERQILEKDTPLYGGIPGSAPFFGTYERFKYPNWAAKFFIDAVISLRSALNGHSEGKYVG